MAGQFRAGLQIANGILAEPDDPSRIPRRIQKRMLKCGQESRRPAEAIFFFFLQGNKPGHDTAHGGGGGGGGGAVDQ